MNDGIEEPKTEELAPALAAEALPAEDPAVVLAWEVPSWMRLAYAVEFLLALIAIVILWSEVGGQGHMDLLPWYSKLSCVLALAWCCVRFTAGIVEQPQIWNRRSIGWFVGIILVGITMAGITFFYHLHEVPEETDTEDTTSASVILWRTHECARYIPVTEQTAEFIFGSWSTPEIQLTVEYPLEVLDEIRSAVCDGLQQLAHGGLEVGGVLFGVRRENTLRMLTWRPISCEHAHGPSLRLSPRDRIDLTRLLEVAKADTDLAGLQPVGWFLSHARSDIFLTQSDLEIFDGFFPEPWQVALVLRPSRSGSARAGFFLREADGRLRSESSYKDFVVEPLHRPGETAGGAGRRPRDLPLELPGPRNGPEPPSAKLARDAEPVKLIEPPRFLTQKPRATGRGRWLWAIPGTLALIIAGMLLKERFLAPHNQPFSFRALGSGQTAAIEWDASSASIQAANRASLDIKDGAETQHYSLTPEQLRTGKMTYPRHSADLELRMTVYPANGASLQEYARVVGAASTPSNHSTNDQPGSPDMTQLRAERDRFEAEAKRLREDLRKEKIRADQVQETLRILQNRIAVDAARGQGPDAKKQ